MTKGLFAAIIGVLAIGLALINVGTSDAAFHLMRIEGVMAGYYGDTSIQYVELRMANSGQNFLSGHDLCFYDASGTAYARFRFASNVSTGTDGSSILVGTATFDVAWTPGANNFTFSPANTTAIVPGADVDHPIRAGGGKVAFGTDTTNTPSLMCQASFTPNLIDSVSYGTGYTGTVNYGAKLNADLPTNSSMGIHLVGPLCIEFSAHPCAVPRDNSVDYSIVDLNAAGNQPRNNGAVQGALSNDPDADGVLVGSDLCPQTAAAAPVDVNGCSDAQVDSDADTICDPGAPSAGPSVCSGSDNCPAWSNASQAPPAWPIVANDPDCDGFPDTIAGGGKAAETAIGTSPGVHCAADSIPNNEPLPDAWPVDFNDNQLVNGPDILQYGAPVFGSHTPGPPYTVRTDLNGDGVISGPDILKFGPYFGKKCA